MKTIYNRLKPDILASINKDKERYPYTTKDLIDKLNEAVDWSELTVSHVSSIINHSHETFLTLSHQDIIWGDKFLTDGINDNR